jgi:hypothetical protein
MHDETEPASNFNPSIPDHFDDLPFETEELLTEKGNPRCLTRARSKTPRWKILLHLVSFIISFSFFVAGFILNISSPGDGKTREVYRNISMKAPCIFRPGILVSPEMGGGWISQ